MIRSVETAEELRELRRLLERFWHDLGADLDIDGFQEELDGLPGPYAPPDGRLLVWDEAGALAGCLLLRNVGDGVCELKRFYVSPLHRGRGIGRELTEEAMRAARKIGYVSVRLHTLPTMLSARAIYDALGFHDVEPWADQPLPGAVFLGRDL
jgi:ribosomal protein S18 acetylase RimI-like enzyme